jgi:methylated-DNA-[protein]-cysteine S-methyltransferase
MSILIQFMPTSFGELILGSYLDRLCLCDWRNRETRRNIDERIKNGLQAVFSEGDSPVIDEAKKQLEAYFAGQRRDFDLPMRLVGTPFQLRVWEELQRVPYGHTETYRAIARQLGNEMAFRAVASASAANAISLFIPCHRIIGSKGELVGYAGGKETKERLLLLEGRLDR